MEKIKKNRAKITTTERSVRKDKEEERASKFSKEKIVQLRFLLVVYLKFESHNNL